MHKTGSSSIQDSLFINGEILRRQDIIYPETGLDYDDEVGHRHLHLSNLLKNHHYSKHKLTDVIKGLQAASQDKIIISHEDLFRLDIAQEALELLAESFDVHLIVFFKDPVLYFNDKYKEWVRRQSCSLEPAEFILQHFDYLHIDKILQVWEKAIKKKNIHVAEFDSSKLSGSAFLKSFYCKVNEITGAQIEASNLNPVKRKNKSLTNTRTLFYLIANKEGKRSEAESISTQTLFENRKGLVLSRESVHQVKARSWHALHYLKTKYGLNIEMKTVDNYLLDVDFYSLKKRFKLLQKLLDA